MCIGRESHLSFFHLFTVYDNDMIMSWRLIQIRVVRAEDFALAEAEYILIRMLQWFEKMEPADEEPWRENLSITLTVASGCRVRLHRAASAACNDS